MLNQMKHSTEEVVKEIFDLYDIYGKADYIGEPISQIEHMSQSAQLAIDEGHDDEVVLAAFFHDIGHICVMKNIANDMQGYGTRSHEKIGADYLREKGFSEKIAKLVESHVQAKRYLTFKYPEYYTKLSDASKQTLVLQGGIMSAQEAMLFEADPLFTLSIRMRQWDEQAKQEGIKIIDLESLKRKIRNSLNSLSNT
jgi:2-amino-1-hydroxyethylphosphonate dioxygenase (glycine-forming)